MTTTNATADERQAFRVWLGGITEDAFQELMTEARQGGFRHGPDWLLRHYRDNVSQPAPTHLARSMFSPATAEIVGGGNLP